MKTLIVIPVRMASKRFPNKPMAMIKGKPMIQWVTENINAEAKFIFIVKKEEYDNYNLKYQH